MSRKAELMRSGPANVLAGSLLFLWVELKALLFYPSNLVMTIIQKGVQLGVWYFVSVFLQGYAGSYVAKFGGSYVAYVVLGVAFNQTALTALHSPFQSIQEAFWDRRLETYHTYPGGIWSHIIGKFFWSLCFSIVIQLVLVIVIAASAGIHLNKDAHLWQALIVYVAFLTSVFGIGLLGASTFFLFEVKRGIEPVGWIVENAVRLTSGLYIPITIIPGFLRWTSAVLPHTYAYEAIRLILLDGDSFASPAVARDTVTLLGFALVCMSAGITALRWGIRRAEERSGVGVVV